MADVVTMMLADHARIHRLFTELDALGERSLTLGRRWAPLARLLEMHVGVIEEICYLPLLTDADPTSVSGREIIADHQDIRESVREARLHPAGSRLWWLAVRAARAAADRHIDTVESGPLATVRQRVPDESLRTLGRYWMAFITALDRDGFTGPVITPGG